ncbi:MAG TPA: hypothetical protein VGT42_07390 [Gammaproteobacteria bacterium]|nr:hypothetical protein [Gammaproteobacteria bacterium]
MRKKSDAQKHCITCGRVLKGRQRSFCGRVCKNRSTNTRHQNYISQQARGQRRKLELIAETGGRCERCGYRKNYAALTWHHLEPAQKSFELDLRAMSNRSDEVLREEITKCRLLCANCHAETHHPECRLES